MLEKSSYIGRGTTKFTPAVASKKEAKNIIQKIASLSENASPDLGNRIPTDLAFNQLLPSFNQARACASSSKNLAFNLLPICFIPATIAFISIRISGLAFTKATFSSV
jgi:hypothetical protein